MSESREHKNLVELCYQYIKTLVDSENVDLINVDSNDTFGSSLIDYQYVPDVLYCYQGNLIIGEAKTSKDFLRKHSIAQYEAYVNQCKEFYGNATIVIAVPWTEMITAKNYFRQQKKSINKNIKIVIINDFGKKEIL